MSTPELSIFLYLRNQEAHVEAFLERCFTAASEHPIELVIIDDASEDNTATIVESFIEASNNDLAFFFRHDTVKGRAFSFNEALSSSTAQAIWLSSGEVSPNYQTLIEAAQDLIKSTAGIGLNQALNTPQSIPGWISLLKEGIHIQDHHFLLNREILDKHRFFFNPYLLQPLCFDLCIRSSHLIGIRTISSFLGKGDLEEELINASDVQELVFSILRHPKSTEPQKVQAFELISPISANSQGISQAELASMLEQAEQFLELNELPSALNVLNRILRSMPYHEPTIVLKVSILEKLKQFVEASELKHTLRKLRKEQEIQELAQTHKVEADKKYANLKEKIDGVNSTLSKLSLVSEPTKAEEAQSANLDDLVDVTMNADNEAVDEQNSANQAAQAQENVGSQDPSLSSISSNDGFNDSPEEAQEVAIKTSVIICTSGSGRGALEQCLTRLHDFANPYQTELIIVDNASQDDTYELLEQIEQDGFLHCKVIRNSKNRGVAASLAQAFPLCTGFYALILHNDCLLEEGALQAMQDCMEQDERILACGPLLNVAHLAEQQLNFAPANDDGTDHDNASQLRDIDYLDGACLMIKLGKGITPDDQYYPAYFEDLDLCWQVHDKKGRCVVALNAVATHHSGHTNTSLGFSVSGQDYWRNAALFAKKWNLSPKEVPIPNENTAPIVIMAQIGERVNFWSPETSLVNQAKELTNAELKTQIRVAQIPHDKIVPLVKVAILLDDREMLRSLEEKIDLATIEPNLVRLLCTYYFEKKVYSRMRVYLDSTNLAQLPLDLQVLHLEMLVNDREFNDAITELERLYPNFPNHPKLNFLAAQIYEFGGEHERANEFREKAEVLNPLAFSRK